MQMPSRFIFTNYFYVLPKAIAWLEQEKRELKRRKIELAENYCRLCALGQKERGRGGITPLLGLLRRFTFLS
ncbi:hypothetical protein [Bartonella apihabitans]|uniref:hypothetical protein n=1 Tax=Bartonella apihabitans TaxID=2750929 RepID=UPI003BB76702